MDMELPGKHLALVTLGDHLEYGLVCQDRKK